MTTPARRTEGPWWDPLREFEDLYSRMGRLWESAFGSASPTVASWAPLADVCETQDAYLVEVDVPGVKQEDLDVELAGTELVVTGELKEVEREGVFRKRTRRTGRFEYRTTLPSDVDAERIEAQLADGVLTLRIPKAEVAKPRRIPITRR
ncbi:MAG TPA: Hsp20/alpha crystallin family protein [Pseudonocardiaceae bacterium]